MNDKQIIKRLTEELEAQQEKIRRLTVLIEERDQLVDAIYHYGKRNPASAPQCVIDLIDHITSEIE